jgi:hypothetical protein
VFLTFLGGGVFGNDSKWIASAIGRALAIVNTLGVRLDVKICHFRSIDQGMVQDVQTAFEKNAFVVMGDENQ